MTRLAATGFVIGGVLLAACGTPPPRPWLRFQPSGPTNFVKRADGRFGASMHGAEVTIDLERQQTRVEVVVENVSAQPVEVRMGSEGGASRNAIGEVLLRPMGGVPGTNPVGPEMLEYNAMQSVKVEPNWRGTFYIDAPLGRDPKVGQYFVLAVEARAGTGAWEARSLPLVAANAGTIPADGQ